MRRDAGLVGEVVAGARRTRRGARPPAPRSRAPCARVQAYGLGCARDHRGGVARPRLAAARAARAPGAAPGLRRAPRRRRRGGARTAGAVLALDLARRASQACSRPRSRARCSTTPARDGLVVAVWAFIGGGLYGALVFWLGGALVYGAARALGGPGQLPARAAPRRLRLRRRSRCRCSSVWPIGARGLRRRPVPLAAAPTRDRRRVLAGLVDRVRRLGARAARARRSRACTAGRGRAARDGRRSRRLPRRATRARVR